ncbi:hypothetical protein [Nannocystis pusilla]|uniref:PEGA domain-containing protein n=1 Tax=Nannocystis pusilla TaxID=889268 RepID=A0ABS7TR46_9BACT|nr:hypothetical protein [Nannocystis pusilla]MBZ5710703.1 hypothetical protein [Nannocystis pusilla]
MLMRAHEEKDQRGPTSSVLNVSRSLAERAAAKVPMRAWAPRGLRPSGPRSALGLAAPAGASRPIFSGFYDRRKRRNFRKSGAAGQSGPAETRLALDVPPGLAIIVDGEPRGNAPRTVFDEHGTVVQTLTTGGSGQAAFRVRLGKYKVELGGRKKTLDIRLPATDVTI